MDGVTVGVGAPVGVGDHVAVAVGACMEVGVSVPVSVAVAVADDVEVGDGVYATEAARLTASAAVEVPAEDEGVGVMQPKQPRVRRNAKMTTAALAFMPIFSCGRCTHASARFLIAADSRTLRVVVLGPIAPGTWGQDIAVRIYPFRAKAAELEVHVSRLVGRELTSTS